MRAASRILLPLALILGSPVFAQAVPRPSLENPRLQTVAYEQGVTIALTALPQTALTLVLEPGEQINRVILGDPGAFSVQVTAERDGLLIQPLIEDAASSLSVATDRRDYEFALRTGTDLMAAYVVEMRFEDFEDYSREEGYIAEATAEPAQRRDYRLRGADALMPSTIHDDGDKTYVNFAPGQALPAIFAIGPTGDEEVVNGYMRDDVFVIDRVYEELVLRIDKKKVTARRLEAERGEP